MLFRCFVFLPGVLCFYLALFRRGEKTRKRNDTNQPPCYWVLIAASSGRNKCKLIYTLTFRPEQLVASIFPVINVKHFYLLLL